MLKYFITITLLNLCILLHAQKSEIVVGNGQILGKVVDAETQSPIEYATIIIYKKGTTIAINGATTNAQGQFIVNELVLGLYTIHAEYIGAKTNVINDVNIDNKHLRINLNTISLEKSNKSLQTVTVKNSAKTIENKIDKMVFNAEKDVSSQIGVATDLLKKIPMVSVDIDGNVQLAGTSSIRFLINGKPSVAFGSNITDVLQSIPANEIKSIEVITNPGAKYDADGLGGIINIILKQNKTKGYNGNINTSIGTLIENGSLNLAARNDNFGVNMFIASNENLLAATPRTMTRTTIDAMNHSTNFIQQEGSSDVKRHGTHSGINFDWTYLKKNNFTAALSNNDYGFDATGYNHQTLSSQIDGAGIIQNSLLNNITANAYLGKGNNYNLSYKRNFDKPDRELNIAYNEGNSNNSIHSSALQYLMPASNLVYGSKNSLASNLKDAELKLDYSEPISDKLKFYAGGKLINTNINSATDVLTQSATQPLKLNNSLSNTFMFQNKVIALYSEIEFPIKNWVDVKIGGRWEQTNVDAFYSSSNKQINPNYNNFVPSLFFKRNLGLDNSIKLSYSRRINRPGYEELNPYINSTDPKNMNQGNPYLLPELGERIELSYNQQIGEKGSVMISLFQRNSDQDIQPYVTYYPSIQVGDSLYYNVNLSKSENIGLEKNTGLNIFGDIKFSRTLSVRTNVSYYYRKIINSIDQNYNATSQNYKANINVTYEFSKTLVSEFFGNFNSARNEVQGKYPANASYSLAVRKRFWKNKGSLGLVANNPFAEFVKQQTLISGPNFYSNSIRYVPSRSFGLSFNWRFGKLEFSKEKKEDGSEEN
ncbi:MAG: outer membrane beta-barrel protein [Chitinophagia bacterium]